MFKPVLVLLDPLLQPVDRTRWLCLLLLVTLVTAMLYLGSRPGVEVLIPHPPWDKAAHLIAFGGFAALAWVVLGARSYRGPLLTAGAISLMDEGMQYYSPGRTADVTDIVADIAGAVAAMLFLRVLREQALRQSGIAGVPATR